MVDSSCGDSYDGPASAAECCGASAAGSVADAAVPVRGSEIDPSADAAGPAVTSRRAALRVAGTAAAVGAAGLVAACANSGSRVPPPARSGHVVIALDEVPVGGVASVIIERRPAFVARPDEDTVLAFSAICTHQSCTVVSAGATLLCPCHGSQFDPMTGAVTRGPAERDLPLYPVHLDDGDVVTD